MSTIDCVTEIKLDMRLARDGGTPARTRPERPMFPGGMELGDEEAEAAARVIRSHNVFRYYGVGDGPHEVADFEREFAEHMGAKHALCLNAGSSALICGLIGAGLRPGDEVIVPAYTWNATPNAVIAARGVPVLAEVDDSLTLDPEDVARKLTPRTKAILPVHMRGAPANMTALTALAAEHGLILIEDACQAAGATFEGQRLGTFGDAGAFSLQFNKIITTGEGGVLITDRDDLYDLAIDVHDCAGLGSPRRRTAPVRRLELPRLRDPGRRRARAALAPRRAAGADARAAGAARGARRAAARPDAAAGERRRRRRRHLPDRVLRRRGARNRSGDSARRRKVSWRCASTTRRSSTCTSTRSGSPCSMRSRRQDSRRPTARAHSTCWRERSTSTSRPQNDEQDIDEIALAFEKVANGVLGADA